MEHHMKTGVTTHEYDDSGHLIRVTVSANDRDKTAGHEVESETPEEKE